MIFEDIGDGSSEMADRRRRIKAAEANLRAQSERVNTETAAAKNFFREGTITQSSVGPAFLVWRPPTF